MPQRKVRVLLLKAEAVVQSTVALEVKIQTGQGKHSEQEIAQFFEASCSGPS